MKFSCFFFSANDSYSNNERYKFILEAARFLDESEFEAIWTPERHFQEFGGCFPSPAVLSAGIATTTRNLKIRAGSVVVPHYHPVQIAEQWALVDQLSNGRVGLCYASGWHKRDFVFYPDNYESRKEVMYSGIDTVQRLFNRELVSFNGGAEQIEVKTFPEPVQQSIPGWLVMSSDFSVCKQAGRRGMNLLLMLNDWQQLTSAIQVYRQSRAEAGLDPEQGVVTIAIHTYIAEDNEKAEEVVQQPLKQYLQTFLKARTDDKGLSGDQPPITAEEQEMILSSALQDLIDNRAMIGNQAKCLTMVERLKDVGVNEIACLVDFGVNFSTVMASLKRLAALKDKFNETEEKVSEESSPDASFHWYFNR